MMISFNARLIIQQFLMKKQSFLIKSLKFFTS